MSETLPKLRVHRVRHLGSGLMVLFVDDFVHFPADRIDTVAARRLVSAIDGTRPGSEIAGDLGISSDLVSDILDRLAGAGVLCPTSSRDPIPGPEFAERITLASRFWAVQSGDHELWWMLERREGGQSLLRGLTMESFHLVDSASRHIGIALDHCTDPRLSRIVTDYGASETGHEELVLEALVQMGADPDQVVGASPLGGTTAVVDHLCRHAHGDTLAWLACVVMIESTGSRGGAGRRGPSLFTDYGFPASAAEPLRQHLEIDAGADHRTLMERAVGPETLVALDRADSVVHSMHRLSRLLDRWQHEIIGHYAAEPTRDPAPARRETPVPTVGYYDL